ncbi:MAG: TetR/AcrR family transcriptional regulator [Solirubrobacteraceae bacterium]|nr:TetR/AcrR family transcriptional regulator [Solirubrobacteraceae bacterium]
MPDESPTRGRAPAASPPAAGEPTPPSAPSGASTPASRGERRRARTRAAILEAAEEAFRRDGFHAARIDEIAERAGLSVGSIYVHFAGKHDLYLALVDRALELFERYMAQIDDPSFTPLQRVLAGGDAYLRFHHDHPGAFRFITFRSAGSDGAPADADTDRRVQERVGALLDRFSTAIDDAVAAGEARPVDARLLTRFLWGAWNGVVGLELQPGGLRLAEDDISAALDLGRRMLREYLGTAAVRDGDGRIDDAVPLPRIADPPDVAG